MREIALIAGRQGLLGADLNAGKARRFGQGKHDRYAGHGAGVEPRRGVNSVLAAVWCLLPTWSMPVGRAAMCAFVGRDLERHGAGPAATTSRAMWLETSGS